MKIGIMGVAGAGKDTFAALLQKHLEGAVLDRFAAPLKEAAMYVFGKDFDNRIVKETQVPVTSELFDRMVEGAIQCCSALGFTEEEENTASCAFYCGKLGHLDPHLFHESPPKVSPREYQQYLGTEVVRGVRESAFADRIAGRKEPFVLVPDCRFLNEVQCVDSCVLVVRERTFPAVRPEHKSEHLSWDLTELYLAGEYNALPRYTYFVKNSGTLEELEESAGHVAKWLMRKD